MATYKPIETIEDLPHTTSARENLVLDFKSTVATKVWWELAKDVAAFANHVGGTLLIGASEKSPDGVHYNGLDADEAESITKAYENAVAEHCLPRPIVRVIPIPVLDGKRVVAVNVEPFPDQPVGARVPTLNRNDEPTTSNGFQFPMRTGRDTRHLTPDQLPLLTNAVVRRNVVLLERIPSPVGDTNVLLVWRHPNNTTTPRPTITPLASVKVDVLANLIFAEIREGTMLIKIEVPLDDIETVWESRIDGWNIRVRGFIIENRTYVSNPLNAPFPK